MTMQHLLLIDGHHLMYRAYYAVPRTLKTSRGELVNTVFGMASMILAAIRTEEPDSLLICFDAGEETFRHEELSTYKDGRKETPDDFFEQIPKVMELVETWGLRHVSDKTFEADDFLCSYALAGERAGMRVTIVTGDKDVFQMASDRIRIAIPHKGYAATEYLDSNGVIKNMGVRPDQVPAFKGLTGDASDNLPGVRGIGPKTAVELLSTFESLEGVFANLSRIRPSVRAKLEQGRQQAFFCQKMAVLVHDIPLPIPLEHLMLTHLSLPRLMDFFKKTEFTLLAKRFQEFSQTGVGRRMFDTIQAPSQNTLFSL